MIVLSLLPHNSKQPLVCETIDFVLESRQIMSIKIARNRFYMEDGLFSVVTDGKTRDHDMQVWFAKRWHLGLLRCIRVFSTDICGGLASRT